MDEKAYEDLIRKTIMLFGKALFTTIHEARKPSGEAAAGRAKAYRHWKQVADHIIAIGKADAD